MTTMVKLNLFLLKMAQELIVDIYKIEMSEEILIVDDNADIRNIINELIIDAGYKTTFSCKLQPSSC